LLASAEPVATDTRTTKVRTKTNLPCPIRPS
jgi:hypothetical protein